MILQTAFDITLFLLYGVMILMSMLVPIIAFSIAKEELNKMKDDGLEVHAAVKRMIYLKSFLTAALLILIVGGLLWLLFYLVFQ